MVAYSSAALIALMLLVAAPAAAQRDGRFRFDVTANPPTNMHQQGRAAMQGWNCRAISIGPDPSYPDLDGNQVSGLKLAEACSVCERQGREFVYRGVSNNGQSINYQCVGPGSGSSTSGTGVPAGSALGASPSSGTADTTISLGERGPAGGAVARIDVPPDVRPSSPPPSSSTPVAPSSPVAPFTGGCAEASVSTDWVFSDAGAFATWRKLCAEGLSPVDALLGAQGHNRNAQASINRCYGQVAEMVSARGMDGMCQRLAGAGAARPATSAVPVPQPSVGGPPACALALQGTFRDYSRVDNPNSVVGEATSMWQTVNGKTTGTSKSTNFDMGGTMEVIAINGVDLVVNWVMTYNGTQYPGTATMRFDPTCSSYTGTTRSATATGKSWGSRIGGVQVGR